MIKLNTDAENIREQLINLRTGDYILLSGTVYTARDAAHKRIVELIHNNKVPPFPLENSFIYYAGPTPDKPGTVIGSCGPTTSARMDIYTPLLLDIGVAATIGKGERSAEVTEACQRNKSIYLCAVGGAGALATKCITSKTVIAFEDLGCESVKKLKFTDFPLTVAVDCGGNNIFDERFEG